MKIWMGFILAFVAGFVDTATFVGARGVFSSHITGNIVLFAVSLIQGIEPVDYIKAIVIIPFVLAIMLVAKADRIPILKPKLAFFSYMVMACLLLITGLYFAYVKILPTNLINFTNFMILLPAFAMGIQNAIQRIETPTEPNITAMTTNVTHLGIAVMNYGKQSSSEHKIEFEKTKAILRVVIGFTLGCIAGVMVVFHIGLAALLVAAGIIFGVAVYKYKLSS